MAKKKQIIVPIHRRHILSKRDRAKMEGGDDKPITTKPRKKEK
jgi:hypothetical protein